MEVFEAIKTMLAVRSYQAKAIPAETVKKIVEAGRLTGSAHNRQLWNFVVVQEAERLRQLGELAAGNGPYIGEAALALAVVVPEAAESYGYIDGTRAVQDMMLVAWEAGIGSNWVGNVDLEPIRSLLNIPADQIILNIISFGYPAQAVGKGIKRRKPLAEVAHREEFGTPFEG